MTTKTNQILNSMGLEELKRLAREKKQKKAQLMEENRCSTMEPKRKIFPLTNAQKSIWTLDQFLEDNKAYNNPLAITCHIDHEFEQDRVERALTKMVNNHDIFGTTIRVVDGEPYQCIDNQPSFDFGFDDITAMPEADKNQWVMRVAREEGRKNFDLTKGPLFRWRMAKTQPGEYIIMLTFHHIISDGWTVSLCFKEFMGTYFGQTVDHAAQFTDYALKESRCLEEGKYEQGLNYWRDKLSGVQSVLELATDHPRPDTINFEGSYVSYPLDAGFCHQLQSCAAKQGATTFHLMLAAYQLLLHKYSNQNDIVIGVPFANRGDAQTQEMMGLFMNTLPLRFTLNDDLPLSTVIEAAKAESEEAIAYQSVPFNRILDVVDYSRDARVNPLYQAVLTYQVYPHSRTNTLFSYSPLKVDYGVSKLDLNLWIEEDGDGLLCTFNYSTALFERTTVQRLLRDLHTILTALVEHPQQSIQALSLVTEDERQSLLKTCLPTEASQALPVHQQFEQQALACPEDVAVRCEGRTLSYAALNERANQLAAQLASQGMGHGEPVAILMEKSEHSVVAILATLKAGGCYLPIDINLPESKIGFILNDAKVKRVLLVGEVPIALKAMATQSSLNWVDILNTETSNTSPTRTNPPDDFGDGPAYIIYTSGSTGAPKGVCVHHSQLSHYCRAIAPVLEQTHKARYGLMSSFSTDLAHTMLFPALVGQGELEIVTNGLLESPEQLANYLKDRPLDCMKITPTHLSALLNAPNAQHLLPERKLVLGGERLPVSLIEKVKVFKPSCQIVNHYGPTECTVGVTTLTIPDNITDLGYQVAPIGQALDGSHVLVLDAHQQLLPAGVPGEICIGGAQLASGYLGLDEQTQRHFVPHPYLLGERLYRTGDKGRLLADGNLEYLGRLDRQVKVRGYRVELAEIEQALGQITSVERAAVVQQQTADSSRLVAYVVVGETGDQKGIKTELKQQLPAYMQPEIWMWLDAMPITASGKINYQGLPEAKWNTQTSAFSHPNNQTQARLLILFQQALSTQQVGIDDEFFNLGGNSISALKLLIEVNKAFSTTLTLGQILENSSVARLSKLIEQVSDSFEYGSSIVMLNQGNPQQKPTLLLIHPAGGNVLCYDELVKGLSKEHPVYGVQVADFQGLAEYNRQVSTLAECYVKQLGELAERPELIIGGWSLGGTLAFEMACQVQALTGNQPKVLVFDQPAPQVNVDNSATMAEHDRLAYFAYKVERLTGTSFGTSGEQLAKMSQAERTQVFLTGFRKANLVPDNISAEDFQHFLAILQAHMKATDEYQGQRYSGPIVVAEAEEILTGRTRLKESGLGWQAYSEQPLTVLTTKGDHISMMNAPHIGDLASRLQEELL
ncbi:non-ribosomal peptide synthetase [Vibrio neptunius]|uniref:Amino acid adenylation domain-containing protein n=1 Tax=Vibrio neptunius TaxID=170651 RepID=A0ABS3A723_9VIBR|nr:non-ribosomal peptide synthetase [Vibrio neptunius]MBN3493861.1 amino acid adenylation domain-containing protein [Vibrio neptunius]MBN3516316.1 amino acid adenylation domain-containing protein [Vibrio neptunius]MBN3550531.1 amino acid adenylation domain-containing protein [Vibrio neptunius]MBN3578662.1 amino acid adenylation domain-containing protein [Vibrio neptunius]MCH9872327.1 amino acid adenylation domain-containing protein [Vibrio neptunius]